jgi:hypothetical protein
MALGAREPCPSLEVDEDVQPLVGLVQLDVAHEPWGLEPQGGLEELLVVHEEKVTEWRSDKLTHSILKRAPNDLKS